MLIGVGLVLVTLAIGMIRVAKNFERDGNRFWAAATHSNWLPLLFTACFGLGFVSMVGGVVRLFGA